MSSNEKNHTSQASYSDLFFRLLEPAFLLDATSLKILELNDPAEKMLDAATPELHGESILRWIPESLRDEFEKQARVTLRRYHPRGHETRFVSPEGRERLYRCDLCQLRAAEGAEPLLQLIAHDITAQREAEERAEKYLVELKSALDDLKSANDRLQEMAITDEMTRVNNFRYFKQRQEIEHQRSVRFKRPYAILFFDLDNFKHYNDRNGHPAGDRLLTELAQLLKRSSRETDCVARYGGEEFVILAPETSESQGAEFAERLRKAIVAAGFAHAKDQPLGVLSASIGVASYPAAGSTPDQVLKAADEAMYRSKKSGKNRVTVFGAPDPGESEKS
jgi:diguanylate cyclase (GGDEF)-like protein/PAS domain S-box-containing protein